MVVNKSIENLISIGFSEYEAKAYVALLRIGPATAYEVAQSSGIPSSKIYEVLNRLEAKDVVATTHREQKKKKEYIPKEPQELLSKTKRNLNNTLDDLEENLSSLKPEGTPSYIWAIERTQTLTEKMEHLISEARESLLISGWMEELEGMETILKEQERKGVSIAIVHFGPLNFTAGQCYYHPIADTLYEEKGGRGIVIVADKSEALMATVQREGKIEGAWSANKGFVTLAEDYIKHDVYIMKIVRRFDPLLIERFGPNYTCLRDVFHDEEA